MTWKHSIHAFLNTLFNLKEKIHHLVSAEEIQLFRNTHLFDQMDETLFQKMLTSIRHRRYSPGELILKEGSLADAFYIIANGSVLVYTNDANQTKIPIARLNKGSYFGEQALLGEANKTRNANIAAITDTTLLIIPEKYFNESLQNDIQLKSRLKKTGYQQALNILSLSSGFYSELEQVFSNIENPLMIEKQADELIFNIGDKPDYAYIILQGEIELQIPIQNSHQFSRVILHKGHLFGELSILQNKPRAATAITHSDVRLLAIKSDDFKRYAAQNPQLNALLSKLNHVYQIPLKGIVEQYTGNIKNMGNTITNIYKMDDGRSITSSTFVDRNIFTMSYASNESAKRYKYSQGENSTELDVLDNHLISIKTIGNCDDLPALCYLLIEKISIDKTILENFEKTGRVQTSAPASKQNEIICECMSVSRNQLQKLIDTGINDLTTLSAMTGACTSCRGCSTKILELLGEKPWFAATLKKIITHNDYINSYQITPIDSKFKSSKPGQYVIIQGKIGDHWIERPYSISDVENNGSLRITVKKEKNGLFSQWLAENTHQEITVQATQPMGDFILNISAPKTALCFAGGIGITPFMGFAKSLHTSRNPLPLNIVYFASTSKDFIFKNEFAEIAQAIPSISIKYRTTREEGPLTEEEIIAAVKEHNEPEIYICGPEGFVNKIQKALLENNIDPARIKLEQFVHAGSAIH